MAVRLTNFAAEIVADVVQDDGSGEPTRVFEIQAGICGGGLRTFIVPSSRFVGMAWPVEHLGCGAILLPGFAIKDHARTAVQMLSTNVVGRTDYLHTGRPKIADQWVYLHGGGAVGALGAVPSVRVSLSSDARHYELPTPPTGDELVEVVYRSLAVLTVAPYRITVSLLTIDEAYKLLAVSGPRRLRYGVHLWTGLRMSKADALDWRDFDVDGDRPYIRLRAETTKAKRADELPLHREVTDVLRDAKPPFAKPRDRVFETTTILRTFKTDLKRAGIPLADEDGRTVDRQALRTTFISCLGGCGVDPRAQIKLAPHAPRGVTLRRYQDFSVFDLWTEIRKLPLMTPAAESDFLRATGTADVSATPLRGGVACPVALRACPKRVLHA